MAKLASSNSNTTARDLVENDNFCGFSDPVRKKDGTWQECECPGQVRWHAGYKLQRLRGAQMALVYLNMLDLAAGATRTSRLACQILLTPDLDHLTLRIPGEVRNMQGR